MRRQAVEASSGQTGPALPLEYVTVAVSGQLVGVPIGRVHDIFVTGDVTRVPLAPPEVAGLVNLRGRVITLIDLRLRFGLPAFPQGEAFATSAEPKVWAGGKPRSGSPPPNGRQPWAGRMAVGIEAGSEHYGLLVDEVGEVLRLEPAGCERNPAHLAGRWAELSAGIHRLADQLLVVLDVDRVLRLPRAAAAA